MYSEISKHIGSEVGAYIKYKKNSMLIVSCHYYLDPSLDGAVVPDPISKTNIFLLLFFLKTHIRTEYGNMSMIYLRAVVFVSTFIEQ